MKKASASVQDRVLRLIGALIPNFIVRRSGAGLAHPALRGIPQAAGIANANRVLAQSRDRRSSRSPEYIAREARIARMRKLLADAEAARISGSSEEFRAS